MSKVKPMNPETLLQLVSLRSQLMRRVVSLRGRRSCAVLRISALTVLIAAVVIGKATGQVADTTRMTVAVSAFQVSGYTRDAAALSESAELITSGLRSNLAQDSSIRWLPDDPRQRQRVPETGLLPAFHHMVVGSVVEGVGGAVNVIWQVLVVEDGRVLAIDTLRLVPGSEREAAAELAPVIIRTIREATDAEPRRTWSLPRRRTDPPRRLTGA